MEFQVKHASGSPSSSTSTDANSNSNPSNQDPMQSWWESISKARARIHALTSILPSPSPSLSSLADSDRPARSLLQSPDVYDAVSSSLFSPQSGSGPDPICQWLYETFQSSDPDLRLVALSFIPLLSGLYLSRVVDSRVASLAGFEAVLLALYASELKARGGKPVSISIADLSQPSLYHTPRSRPGSMAPMRHVIGLASPPLEPQSEVKSTKRTCIVGVALDCYYKQISQMPSWSKLDLCRFAAAWAGQNCPCKAEFDGDEDAEIDGSSDIRVLEGDAVEGCAEDVEKLSIAEDRSNSGREGARIPLPWELLQPTLRIIGHCLLAPLNSQDVKDAASVAVRCLYARASHDLLPQAILATRSLVKLDKREREAAKAAAAAANSASNSNTPSKAKKPEVFLVAK